MFTWLDTRGVLGALIAILGAALFSLAAWAPASAQTSEEQFRAEIAQRRESAAELSRENEPVAWAVAQTELASGLYQLWDRDSVTEAVALYRVALEVLTPEATPAEWLVAQEGLGDALLRIAMGRSLASAIGMFGGSYTDPGLDSRDAALVFMAALDVQTRERDRMAWARLQTKLGYALTILTTRQRFSQADGAETDLIQEQAEQAFRHALSALSSRANPVEWAWANEGLIMLYSTAATFIGQEYVEDEAALRRSEARRVPYVRAAMAAAREAERAYARAGDQDRAQDMRQRRERLREDLRPNRIIPDWLTANP
jgi:hypothetical protein